MVVLAVVGLALVLALSWQAVASARQHRQMAEEVLRDYAELAADEFMRRSAGQVGYYGFYPPVTTLVATLSQPDASLTTAQVAIEEAEQGALVAWTFRTTDEGVERTRPATGPGEPELEHWIAERLAALPPDSGKPFGVLHGAVSGTQRLVVYGRLDSGYAGFEADRAALVTALETALAREPLLPASLGQGDGARQPSRVRVLDPRGEPMMDQGELSSKDPYATQLTAEVPYGDSYQGILDGYTVSVSLDPTSADSLVIGGLPRTRLPLLVGLAALALACVSAALLAARRMQQVAQLRTDFIARVSHELRTPLTQIRMFAETLLLDRARDAETRQRALVVIDREAQRLSHLVDNILRFSQTDHKHPEPLAVSNRRRQPIRPLLEQVVERIRALVVGQTLTVDDRLGPDTEVEVEGDALHRMLLNLVDNALKYGPADQHVRLGWSEVDHTVWLAVEDEGPGIPEAQRHQIWRDFERLDRPVEAAVAGTGIGLSVVRELVAQQEGRVWVENREDGGARFVIELPIAPAHGADP